MLSHTSNMVVINSSLVRIANAHEWISRNPFLNWKAILKVVDREFLTKGELQRVIGKEIENERLSLVKDIFLSCCFTGLAYADVKKLSSKEVVTGFDGNRWIKMNRTKTKTRSSIPILPTAEAILEKNSSHHEVSDKKLLPVLTN